MHYRVATTGDFPAIHQVRMAVLENRLSDPGKVTRADYEEMIVRRGRGWVCEMDGQIVGFSIVDLVEKNVWALFLLPSHIGMGIGKKLQSLLLEWAFANGTDYLWLSTAPGTRAELFYEKTGWQKVGLLENGEMKFERHDK
ncbi:MAG: GNAT family N-acetyltransferase [Bacteroidota bacterium]